LFKKKEYSCEFRIFIKIQIQNYMKTRISDLLGIKYPIIQAGMIWCSGWKLAAAVSEAGGLGLIGAGSMYPDVFEEHIRKLKAATQKPFGVNLPLLYPQMDEIIEIVLREKVKIVFTSAGNPKKWTALFKENGMIVAHVVAGSRFALKAQDAGVDAIVAEGFEAGGHNGIEETTTMTLLPLVKKAVDLPVIAAGGIATGRQMLAAFVLGAEAVQVGSRFVATTESSAHEVFKQKIIEAGEGDTKLTLKQVVPVRLIKNKFFFEIDQMQKSGAAPDELKAHLGRGRAKLGMFEGNPDDGELEIGQVSALINEIKPAGEIVREMMAEFEKAKLELCS
jgi:enoyl-[acyl-carrier protein] reductase II